uniref:Uncharacterized protein n=1 Tax=Spongospora subterranea TaxID=70186 RepID=A0A0H5REX7_9EUKA|eukprot:CRZ12092.1 hypothetical protein [Spongospora subterranea]
MILRKPVINTYRLLTQLTFESQCRRLTPFGPTSVIFPLDRDLPSMCLAAVHPDMLINNSIRLLFVVNSEGLIAQRAQHNMQRFLQSVGAMMRFVRSMMKAKPLMASIALERDEILLPADLISTVRADVDELHSSAKRPTQSLSAPRDHWPN